MPRLPGAVWCGSSSCALAGVRVAWCDPRPNAPARVGLSGMVWPSQSVPRWVCTLPHAQAPPLRCPLERVEQGHAVASESHVVQPSHPVPDPAPWLERRSRAKPLAVVCPCLLEMEEKTLLTNIVN
ncbi:hypothetical protein UY3_17620 [Chelonia mydas]|uniref:Uncharacterized protein n=1 Tax=Chelonia mydas TaxID=8469 RepID=M7ALG1_CHEMY|nr:hypothetical protein UY3_17620 [Chelonia mydas]